MAIPDPETTDKPRVTRRRRELRLPSGRTLRLEVERQELDDDDAGIDDAGTESEDDDA